MLYISTPTNHFRYNEQGDKVPVEGISAEAFKDLEETALVIGCISELRCLDNVEKVRASAELMQEYYRILGRALK